MKTILPALVLVALCSAAADTPPSLLSLRRDDRVHVLFQSRGCFHSYRYQIDLEGGDVIIARSKDGRMAALSSAQRRGLARLIEFYRKPEGLRVCTTEDEVTLTYFRSNQKFATEHFLDRSCATGDKKNITRFSEVAEKLGIKFR